MQIGIWYVVLCLGNLRNLLLLNLNSFCGILCSLRSLCTPHLHRKQSCELFSVLLFRFMLHGMVAKQQTTIGNAQLKKEKISKTHIYACNTFNKQYKIITVYK